MQYTLPIDIAGNIAEYGGLVSLPKEEILARILTIDPGHNFNKDYLVRMYKKLALESEYGKIIEYCYGNGIRMVAAFNYEVERVKVLVFSSIPEELRDLFEMIGFSVQRTAVHNKLPIYPVIVDELKFYWQMYNCVLSLDKDISQVYFQSSVGEREPIAKEKLKLFIEIIPTINGFNLGPVVESIPNNPNRYWLNYIGIINSLGLRFVPENSYTIPDQLINPHDLEWYDLFERHELLEILNETNRIDSFKRRNRGTLQEKLLQVLLGYDVYSAERKANDTITVAELGKAAHEVYENLRRSFNDGSIQIELDPDSSYKYYNDELQIVEQRHDRPEFLVEINHPIFLQFYKLYIAYNNINYDVADTFFTREYNNQFMQ